MSAPPDPDALYPVPGDTGTVLLKPLLALYPDVSNVTAGDYSYYHDHEDPLRFLERCVRYNFGFGSLSIGRYCAIAHRATFLMPGANHAIAGPSTFPFGILGGSFAEALPLDDYPWRGGGPTTVGHDVWLGTECMVLPGVTIGHGAIIGARGGRHARRAALCRCRRQSGAGDEDALLGARDRPPARDRLVGLAGRAGRPRHPGAGHRERCCAYSRLSTPSTRRSAQGVLWKDARSASSE